MRPAPVAGGPRASLGFPGIPRPPRVCSSARCPLLLVQVTASLRPRCRARRPSPATRRSRARSRRSPCPCRARAATGSATAPASSNDTERPETVRPHLLVGPLRPLPRGGPIAANIEMGRVWPQSQWKVKNRSSASWIPWLSPLFIDFLGGNLCFTKIESKSYEQSFK